jgi:hypothetical protein
MCWYLNWFSPLMKGLRPEAAMKVAPIVLIFSMFLQQRHSEDDYFIFMLKKLYVMRMKTVFIKVLPGGCSRIIFKVLGCPTISFRSCRRARCADDIYYHP